MPSNATPPAAALPTYSALYAFGDSLSDAGNLSIVTAVAGREPVSPPYHQEQYGSISGNVFSNGPTWVQDLSVALGLGTLSPSLATGNDFAYGGAETGPTPQNASNPGIEAISLPAQLTQFQAKVPSPSANALYTVSIGANDLLAILSSSGLSAAQQTTDVTDAVSNEIGFIKSLVTNGAKSMLVLNVPDLGKTPDVMQGQANGSGVASAAFDAEATQLTAEYNTQLASQLTTVTGLSAKIVDGFTLVDNAVAGPVAYGLSNVTTPVWSGNFTSASSGTLAATGTGAQNQYLFWDHLHPTEAGHQAIASLAQQQLGDDNAALISRFYTNILQRAPDATGLASWQGAVSGGTLTLQQVNDAFATSAEATSNVKPIVELYAALGRAPDVNGLHRWVHTIETGTTITTVAGDFLASPEGQGVYGAPGTSAAANTQFVDTEYQKVLGRTPDSAGAQNWISALNAGVLSPAQELVAFIGSVEAQARNTTPITNFLLAAGNGTAPYGSAPFPAASASVLADFTAPAGISAAPAIVPAATPASLGGAALATDHVATPALAIPQLHAQVGHALFT
ncbi:DUF4214 domain-containing protein [Lichenicoccus sp.]|uniref:DUF4214 domain-containing protein n=1 Tax=Lichenicoccus sp. TaxID=2781899 RepID=UPI003D0B1318